MTTKQWVIIAVLFAAVLILFCAIGVFVLAALSPSPTGLVTIIVTATPSTPTDTPTPRPSPTPQPTPTLAVLKMTIDEIEKCCKDMTTIQEKQYLSSLVGSRVNWQGTIDDVKPDGTVWVKVSATRIEMNGTPAEVASKLTKGQFISFYAIITKAENAWLMPGVQLRFESLNTNTAAATSSQTQIATRPPISSGTPQATLTLHPLTPNEKLTKLAKDGLEKEILGMFLELRSATITGTTAIVDYTTTDSVFNQESAVSPFMGNLENVVPQVFDGIPNIAAVEIKEYTSMKDAYGKSVEAISIRIVITRTTNSKISWKGFSPKNLPKVLTGKGDSFFIHPALSSGWATYQQKY